MTPYVLRVGALMILQPKRRRLDLRCCFICVFLKLPIHVIFDHKNGKPADFRDQITLFNYISGRMLVISCHFLENSGSIKTFRLVSSSVKH